MTIMRRTGRFKTPCRSFVTITEHLLGSAVIRFLPTSDAQTTARGPDAARLEVLSGPRQILK